MAIADSDTVFLVAASDVGPAPPLRGIVRDVAGARDVFWENGRKNSGYSVADLAKILPPPPAASAWLHRSVKILMGDGPFAQEAQGVVMDTYVSELDAGPSTQAGHLIVLVTGRGDGSPACFVDIEGRADFSAFAALRTTNVYPRY